MGEFFTYDDLEITIGGVKLPASGITNLSYSRRNGWEAPPSPAREYSVEYTVTLPCDWTGELERFIVAVDRAYRSKQNALAATADDRLTRELRDRAWRLRPKRLDGASFRTLQRRVLYGFSNRKGRRAFKRLHALPACVWQYELARPD